MIFKINNRYFYDNVKNIVYNDNKTIISPTFKNIVIPKENNPREYIKNTIHNECNVHSKSKNDVGVVRFPLDEKCNMECRYCFHGKHHNNIKRSYEDISKLVDSVCKKFPQVNVIELYGNGEPLCQYDTFKMIIDCFKSIKPNIGINTFVNGSLLNEEIVDYFIKNNISTCVSYDGSISKITRNYDLAEHKEKIDLIKKLAERNRVQINVVITPYNIDLKKEFSYIQSIFGKNVHIEIEDVICYHNTNVPLDLQFTKETSERLSDNISNIITNGYLKCGNNLKRKVERLASLFFTHYDISENLFTRCAQSFDYNVNVTLDGDIVPCDLYKEYLGSVYDDTLNISDIDFFKYHSLWTEREKCKSCIALSACRSRCPLMPQECFDMDCHNDFGLHYGVFKGTWELLFGFPIETYELVE